MPVPTLSARGSNIISFLYNEHVDLARGSDDDRRALTKLMAEQFCFEFGSAWGVKSADPGRPQSKDAIAFFKSGALYAVDWQNGDSRAPQVGPGSELIDITGQTFIPVQPVDHLVHDLPSPVDPPPPTPTTPPILDRLTAIEVNSQLSRLADVDTRAAIEDLRKAVQTLIDRQPPVYGGSIFGVSFRLNPVKS